MRLAVFGASGRTGRLLVEQALEVGHEVVAFVRDPAKLGVSDERLTVVRGNVEDAGRVSEAVRGADAVLSALGHTKTSGKDVQAAGIRNIVAAMEEQGVRRLVSLTGAGVRDDKDEPKLSDRLIAGLLGLLQGDVLRDAEEHARIVKGSGLEWVIVRAPMLTDGERTGRYTVGYVGRESGSRVSRADVADFMLRQVEEDDFLGRAPMVSYGKQAAGSGGRG